MSSLFRNLCRALRLPGSPEASDGQLLERFVATREEGAFAALVERHGPMIHGVCRRILGDGADADDAFQATFLVLVRKAGSIVPPEMVGNWLHGVACRTARNARATSAKRRAKERAMRDIPREDAPVPATDLRPILDAELEKLPARYRASIVLCDLEGKSRQEAARQLGLSEGTLSSRLARGRDLLRLRLHRRGLTLPAAALAAALAASAAPAAVPAALLSATISTGALVAAGQTIAASAPVSVALLTEGVLKAMFFSKLKIAAAMFLAIGVIGTGAGVLTHQTLASQAAAVQVTPRNDADLVTRSGDPKANEPSATEVADKGDAKEPPKDKETTNVSGSVVAVAGDGKGFTIEIPSKVKRDPGQRVGVSLTNETVVSYAVCPPDGARPTVGYSVVVRLKPGSANLAARVQFTGPAEPKPSFSGEVNDVKYSAASGEYTVSADGPNKGTKLDRVVDVGVFPFKPGLATYFNVPQGGARPTKGYFIKVWQTEKTNEIIRIEFDGHADPAQKPAGKPERNGPVLAGSKDSVTIELPPQAKGEAPERAEFKITDQTVVLFNGVGAEGAVLAPDKGLNASIWLAQGSKDTAVRVQVNGGVKNKAPDLVGKLIEVKDGKQLALEVTGPGKPPAPQHIEVRITPKTRLSYRNVGPDAARPIAGYHVSVWLAEGEKNAAELVWLEPADAARKSDKGKPGEQEKPVERPGKGQPEPTDKGKPTDKPLPSDKPTDKNKQEPTDKAKPEPADKRKPIDKPPDKPTEKKEPTDKARPEPADKTKPTDKPPDKTKPTDKPPDKTSEKKEPTDKGKLLPADKQPDQPLVLDRAELPEPAVPTRDPLPVAAAIDREIDKRLSAAGVPASPLADDGEFLRRVSLDIAGRIPTLERSRSFLDSTDPDKRRKLIDELLASPAFGQHFGGIWRNLIVPRVSAEGKGQADTFTPWLAEQFNSNRGWDRMVTELLTAEGPVQNNPAISFTMANAESFQPQPNMLAASAARLFLGVQLQCAECHDHPFTPWKQADFWATAAFFARLHNGGGKGTFTLTEQTEFVQQSPGKKGAPSRALAGPGGTITIPPSAGKGAGKVVKAKFLSGEEPPLTDDAPLRPRFAAWATARDNPYFAPAQVNRLWAQLFGRGLVHPVDNFHEGNPPSHPALLQVLADEFRTGGHDVKHVVRCICNSRAYQRASTPLPENEADGELFSHMAIKPLAPESLYDSLNVLGAVGMPAKPGAKGAGVVAERDSAYGLREQFLAQFRAPGEQAEAGELTYGIPQFLRRLNGQAFNRPAPLVERLARSGASKDTAIEDLYLAALARRPTARERQLMTDYLAKRSKPEEGYAGVLWILINSGEFVLNH